MHIHKFIRKITLRYLIIPYFIMLLFLITTYFHIYNKHTHERMHQELLDINHKINFFLKWQINRAKSYVKKDIQNPTDLRLSNIRKIITNFMFNNEYLYDRVGFLSEKKNVFLSTKEFQSYNADKIDFLRKYLFILKQTEDAWITPLEENPFNHKLRTLIFIPVTFNQTQKGTFVFFLYLDSLLERISFSLQQRLGLQKEDYEITFVQKKKEKLIHSSLKRKSLQQKVLKAFLEDQTTLKLDKNKYYLTSLSIDNLDSEIILSIRSRAITSFHNDTFAFFIIILLLFSSSFILLYKKSGQHLNTQFEEFYLQLKNLLANQEIENLTKIKIFEFRNVLIRVKKLRKKLSETLEKEKELFTFIAHDLLSPLNYINMGLQLLEIYPDNQEIKNAVMMGGVAVKEMASNFIALNQMDKSKLKIQKTTKKYSSFLDALEKKYAGFARIKGLDFELMNKMQKDSYVTTDFEKLHRIIDNLFFNALKHTDNGKISLVFDISKERGEILILVKDTGKGIPYDLRKKLFKEYIKGDSSDGSGLGLYITKLFIKKLKGQIQIPDSDTGTSFLIQIPVEIMEINNL